MSEPHIDSDPRPITPTPFDQSERSIAMGGGCGRAGLIGCGVLILLLGVGAVVLLLKADDFLAWALRRMETEIVEHLPADCTPEEKERLQGAFDAATEAITEGTVDPASLQEFMRAFNRFLPDAAKTLDREQIQELTRLLERVGGRTPEQSRIDPGGLDVGPVSVIG